MAKTIVWYEGNLRVRARHERSGNELITDAPVDNHGKGEAFSPTDLLAASLITCMITVMGIKAQKDGYDPGSFEGSVEKHMTSGPRRVKKLVCHIRQSGMRLTEEQKKSLTDVSDNCPVALSLHPEIEFISEYQFQD